MIMYVSFPQGLNQALFHLGIQEVIENAVKVDLEEDEKGVPSFSKKGKKDEDAEFLLENTEEAVSISKMFASSIFAMVFQLFLIV